MYYNYEMSLLHANFLERYKFCPCDSYKMFIRDIYVGMENIKGTIKKRNKNYFTIETETGMHKLLITEGTENFKNGDSFNINVVAIEYEPEKENHRLLYTYVYLNNIFYEDVIKFKKESNL